MTDRIASLGSRRALLCGAGAALTTGTASARVPLAGRQVPGIYRFQVGGFELTALHDGQLGLPTTLFPDADPAALTRVTRAAFLAEGAPVSTPVNAFLLNTGERLWLIDAGTGAARGSTLGHVVASMEAAGVKPEQVDAVLMTHLHIDHAAGLTRPDGSAIFSNAELHIPEPELAFWLAPEAAGRMSPGQRASIPHVQAAAKAYHGRITLFRPGVPIATGIDSISLPGHTPGHAGFMISCGRDQLFLWADIVHVAAFQFAYPAWVNAFDVDPLLAAASRQRAMDQASSDRLLVAGMHLPFPGIGHVVTEAAGFSFVPSSWSVFR